MPYSVLVTGASSQIGEFLLPLLVDLGFHVHAVSRSHVPEVVNSVHWHSVDIETGLIPLVKVDCVIHLAPLPLLPRIFPGLQSALFMKEHSSNSFEEGNVKTSSRRLIAFGSTSRLSKLKSGSLKERTFALELGRAEREVSKMGDSTNIKWTLFRPTLIYGCGIDKNVTLIAKFIDIFGFFPLIGKANGLRQPVHAEDLAIACIEVLENPAAFNKSYNLSGGETLTYREMVERIFVALGRTCRFIKIPLSVFRITMRILSLLPSYRYLSSDMAARMVEDLCFDHSEASRDFGFAPRTFQPTKAELFRSK